MRILAIDPGNVESGYALIEMPDFKPVRFGKEYNNRLIDLLPELIVTAEAVAIEMVACYGMPVGRDVFETCEWIGRFRQFLSGYGVEPHYIYRKEEKMALCGSMKAKDSNIRKALINRYATHDYKTGKGTKDNPDTFYGVKRDVWQAIAVGVTYWENKAEGEKHG